jgi:Uma2 family endonuclease
VAAKGLTLEQFLELPEEKPALEFLCGEVRQKVSPQGRHSVLQVELASQINAAGSPGKVARAFPELRTTYAGLSTVPDVSVYRWKRIPVNESGRVLDVFSEPPDVAVEIVSPQQSVNALVRRCLWYVEHGVGRALLVDPDDDSVLVFRHDETARALRGADGIDLGDLLPDFALTVEELFASLRMA